MDSFELLDANDDVAEGGTVVQNEDGVVTAGVGIGITSLSSIELLVSIILNARDNAGGGEGDDAANAGWDVQGLRCTEASEDSSNGNECKLHFDIE